MKNRPPFPKWLLLYAIFPAAIIAALIFSKAQSGNTAVHPSVAGVATAPPASSSATPKTPENPPRDPASVQKAGRTFDTFQLRPFPVAQETGAHAWTAEDGKDPDVILELAHNDLEVDRMMKENERIKRRQLVYRKETVPMLLDRARATGEPLRAFTLPGLDGREVEVEVMGTQLNSASNAGSVTGRVKGRFNSMVSVGFANGCESFNVLSPEDGLFLTADAREPGEVIVKEIDPDEYSPFAGNTPDFIPTNQPLPKARTK